MVYSVGSKHEIIALDLQTARPRPQPLATRARRHRRSGRNALQPSIDSLRVVQFIRRSPFHFPAKLPAAPRISSAPGRLRCCDFHRHHHVLTVLRTDDSPTKVELPSGDIEATFWGDLLAIAADTAVILVDPEAPEHPVSVPIPGHARAVIFSPSGHRFYVLDGKVGYWCSIGSLGRRWTKSRCRPAPARSGSIRSAAGSWCTLPNADSLWLVDLARNRYVGGFAADWASDLPTVTNQQTLLLKIGPMSWPTT